MAAEAGLQSYIIRGGEEGRARLGVLAEVMAPTTGEFLDRIGSFRGLSVIDAACGGGDVSLDLAERVGPNGRVDALDLDEEKLSLARSEAVRRGVANVTFHAADVSKPWPVAGANIVYARFILTHLVEPERFLRSALDALVSGGTIVVEDIDMEGGFSDPPCDAYRRYLKLYIAAGQRRGADPLIGRRLARLVEGAGFTDVRSSLVQPFGRSGGVKRMASLTLEAISGSLIESGLATRDELTAVLAELDAFGARLDTTMSIPRVFQAWGKKP